METIKTAIIFPALLLSFGAHVQAQGPTRFTISTFAGTGAIGYSGDGGAATNAAFGRSVSGVSMDPNGIAYIGDPGNNRIRKVALNGIITTFAGNGSAGFSGDGGPATQASLNNPTRVLADSSGNVYIADDFNNRIRKVDSNGIITTVAGNGSSVQSGDGGPAINAGLGNTGDMALDAAGNLYLSTASNQIRKVTPSGIISTVAGNGTAGFSGDGGAASAAALNAPKGMAIDSLGNLFIADSANARIRRVSNGIITTVAGTGTPGYAGDGGPAINARLSTPVGVALDPAGNLYVADYDNNRIRILLANGTISTVAGNGAGSESGDGGSALAAALNGPRVVALAPSGSVYIADVLNNRIRLLTPIQGAPSISVGGVVSASAFGQFPSVAQASWIEIYGSNLAADTRGWGGNDFKGNNAPTSLDGTTVTIGGQPAFVAYISPGQVNAQVPSTVPLGQQPVVIGTATGSSGTFTVTVNGTQAGLLAPAAFSVGGNQYIAGFFSDGATFVLPSGAVPGVVARRATAGDTITFYGVGFGAVTPSIPAGQIVQQSNALALPFHLFFGTTEATLAYAGLAPGEIGLYQFNVVVPNVAASDTVPVTFTLGGVPGTQKLYTSVQ